MPRARRRANDAGGPLPRVILCAALTVDGKLDPEETMTPAYFPWADWKKTDTLLFFPAVNDVTAQLGQLRRDGARRVFCTGGASVFRAHLDAGVVTELWLALRPYVDGRREAPTLSGLPGADWFPASLACRLVKMEIKDGAWLLRYRMVGKGKGAKERTGSR